MLLEDFVWEELCISYHGFILEDVVLEEHCVILYCKSGKDRDSLSIQRLSSKAGQIPSLKQIIFAHRYETKPKQMCLQNSVGVNKAEITWIDECKRGVREGR